MIERIINGELDADLDKISQAVNMRRKTLRSREQQVNLVTIEQGDRVRTKNLSPKYINGLTATVIEKKRTRFVVQFDDGQYTGRFSGRVTVPANALEAI